MAKKPETNTGGGYDRKARAAIRALADFVAAMGPLPSKAEEARQAALAEARNCGWKG